MFFMIFIKKLDQVIQKVISTPVPEDSVLNFGKTIKKYFIIKPFFKIRHLAPKMSSLNSLCMGRQMSLPYSQMTLKII